MYEKIPKGFKNELKRFERQVKNRRRDRESETLRDEKLRDNHMRYIFVVFFSKFFEKSSINEKNNEVPIIHIYVKKLWFLRYPQILLCQL